MRKIGLGGALFAASVAGLAILCLCYGNFAMLAGPLPGPKAWTYVVGVLLAAACGGLLLTRTLAAGAVIVAAFCVVWSVVSVPPIAHAPLSIGSWYGLSEAVSVLVGVWTSYALNRRRSHPATATMLTGDGALRVGRILFGAATLVYGCAHFAYAQYSSLFVPTWLPAQMAWVYLTGSCFCAAGLGLILGVLPLFAATLEAVMITLFGILVWLPTFFAHPTPKWAGSLQNQWSETLLTFALAAVAWIIAEAICVREHKKPATVSKGMTTELDIPALKAQFDRDGFLALKGYFPVERIDSANRTMERLLRERGSEIVVDSCVAAKRAFWSQITEGETRHFKFNDLYLLSDEIRQLALDPGLVALMKAFLGEAPVLCNSLNFEKGSTQPKHIDSLYMTPQSAHALIASWTALEDAHPDSGPLRYVPGSHLIPLFTFPDGSHHATPAVQPLWDKYIDEQIRERGLKEEVFLAKRGDVFIWHSDLVHGGSPIRDPNRTRKSLVCHFFVESDVRNKLKQEVASQNGAYWLKRLRQPVKVDPAQFKTGMRFPEEVYLARYPDVAEAVRSGALPSGQFHYEHNGFAEGRGV